jgi:hypothetical protein
MDSPLFSLISNPLVPKSHYNVIPPRQPPHKIYDNTEWLDNNGLQKLAPTGITSTTITRHQDVPITASIQNAS